MVEHALMWDDARRVVSRPSGPVAALALLVSDQRELDILVGIEGLTNPLAREAAGISGHDTAGTTLRRPEIRPRDDALRPAEGEPILG